MLRKNAVFLTLTVVLVLAFLAGLPAMNATSHSLPASSNHSSILADEIPTPTPTPGGGSTDSGTSGGGNGG